MWGRSQATSVTRSIHYYEKLIDNFDMRARMIQRQLPEYDEGIAASAAAIMDNIKLVLGKRSEIERMKLYALGKFIDGGTAFKKRFGIREEEIKGLCQMYPDMSKVYRRFLQRTVKGQTAIFKEHYPKILQMLHSKYLESPDVATTLNRMRENFEQLKRKNPAVFQRLFNELATAFEELHVPEDIKSKILFGRLPLHEKLPNMTEEEIAAFIDAHAKEFFGSVKASWKKKKSASVDFDEGAFDRSARDRPRIQPTSLQPLRQDYEGLSQTGAVPAASRETLYCVGVIVVKEKESGAGRPQRAMIQPTSLQPVRQEPSFIDVSVVNERSDKDEPEVWQGPRR